MNKTTNSSINNKEVDINEIIRILKHYKLSIILTTLIVTFLAALNAYFATDIYQVRSTLEVKSDKGTDIDFMTNALGGGSNNVDNEIEMLQSQWIINKTIPQLNLNVKYFTKNNYKTVELYKNSPFVVTTKFISKEISSPFILIPYDEKHFILSIKPSLLNSIIFNIRSLFMSNVEVKQPIAYNEKHKYGEEVKTPLFNLKVQKIFIPENDEYTFIVQSNKQLLKTISKNLSVSTISQMGTIIVLNYEDNVPLRGTEILNSLTNTYVMADINQKTQGAQKTLDFLDKQLRAINETLEGSSKTLEQYKATNVIVNLGAKAQITAQKLSDLEKQLYEVDMQLDVLNSVLSFIETNQNDLTNIDLASTTTMSPTISNLILTIQKAKTLKKTLLDDYTDLHPDVIKINNQLSSLKDTLKNTIKSSIRSLYERKITINKFIDENTASLESLPQQEQELARINRNFLVNQKIYSYLLQKRAETAIVESSTVSKTRIIDKAILPDIPVKPKRSLMIIVSFILGLIVSIVLALFRNYQKKTIDSIEEFEKLSTLPIYGILPKNIKNRQNEAFDEALRVIRTNIEFVNSDTSKLLTFTSSVQTEGKTTVSTEVSKIIASSDKKVLLIDVDMRRGRIHDIFNVHNDKGMSTLLSMKSTLTETIIPTKVKNLYMITSGPKPPNPSELIMSKNFNSILDSLQDKFDYIILDSPPIGLVTDAMMLMKRSDLSLFVFREKFSKKDFLYRINKLAQDQDLKAGAILNSVDYGDKNKTGYGYGYGYGYSYD